MTYLETWLLHSVHKYEQHLRALSYEDMWDQAAYFNDTIPASSLGEIADTLLSLFESGLMEFGEDNGGDLANTTLTSEQEILDVINSRRDIRYLLTQAGGALWEKLFSPRWDEFIGGCISTISRDPYIGNYELIGVSKLLCEERIKFMESWQGLLVIDGSVSVAEIRNWDATYWKTLPAAHVVTAKMTPRPGFNNAFFRTDAPGSDWFDRSILKRSS